MLVIKWSYTHLGIATQKPITTVYPTIKSSTNKPTVTLEPHNGGKKSKLLFVAKYLVLFSYCYNYYTVTIKRIQHLKLSWQLISSYKLTISFLFVAISLVTRFKATRYSLPKWLFEKFSCYSLNLQELLVTLKNQTLLQSWTKYLRQTLVFIWNSALQEKFDVYFSGVFC